MNIQNTSAQNKAPAHPRLEHNGSKFYFDGIPIDLSDSPLSARLFELFFEFPNEAISKYDILAYVYRLDLDNDYSERFLDTCFHNTIKLLSRCRKLAEIHWGNEYNGLRIKWMPFDSVIDGWRVFTTFEKKQKNSRKNLLILRSLQLGKA